MREFSSHDANEKRVGGRGGRGGRASAQPHAGRLLFLFLKEEWAHLAAAPLRVLDEAHQPLRVRRRHVAGEGRPVPHGRRVGPVLGREGGPEAGHHRLEHVLLHLRRPAARSRRAAEGAAGAARGARVRRGACALQPPRRRGRRCRTARLPGPVAPKDLPLGGRGGGGGHASLRTETRINHDPSRAALNVPASSRAPRRFAPR